MPIKRSLIPKLLLVLAIAYTIALVIVSLMDLAGANLPSFNQADKLYHMVAYFGLTSIWCLFYYSKKKKGGFQKRVVVYICLGAILFGILLEVLQGTLTEYRNLDIFDALANSTGVFLAVLVIFLVGKKLIKVKNQL